MAKGTSKTGERSDRSSDTTINIDQLRVEVERQYASGNYDDVAKAYSKLKRIDSSDFSVTYIAVMAYLADLKFERAYSEAQALHDHASASNDGYFGQQLTMLLAYAAIKMGNLDEARYHAIGITDVDEVIYLPDGLTLRGSEIREMSGY
jgi:hypothetical protein